ncbi:3'-5' exonuclease [Nocardioides psychrotolerans]|uniref:DNA polymerase-3 subunit epsilon n=1 Tax=Nocardioides psychrotolerans TaxID=1005945 RepID=A0A1I3LLF6_9ACTN|nr:hypothetical protein [Nocardioides psychrotolerans]GEP38854.1 3'-5' exonuclease [Nocardioides psychrotolerans]SFI85552.1 DNA polymerase-3 subunit epsilon [Nocardioides psychrotolerans]
MSAPKWHDLPLVAFDTETTGIDLAEARIVTAAIVHMTPGQRPRAMRWLIDPGVEIPDEAAAIHGWTTDRIAQTIGRPGWAHRTMVDSTGKTVTSLIPAHAAVFEITAQLGAAMGREAGVVIQNAAYDLTLLEAENGRYDVPTLSSRPAGVTGVVDPMVIEKQFDPYRKACYKAAGCNPEESHHECGGCRGGKVKCGGCGSTDRKLESLCGHYGVRHGGAHDAADDAVAAARLLRKLLEAWPQVAAWKLATLHHHEVAWRREQMDGLRSFFDRVGKDHDGCCGAWPLHDDACAGAHRQAVAA